MKAQTIAITGSSGFVGFHLAAELRLQGVNVIELDLMKGIDIADWQEITVKDSIDTVIHLASRSFVPDSFLRPREVLENNIDATINMLELSRINNARMIYASSYVYGSPKYLPIDEEHPLAFWNPYASSKIIGENLCRCYNENFGLRTVILRPFNIFGNGQDSRFLIPSIIDKAKTGRIDLKDPEPRRDFVYIDDVVEAFIKAAEYDYTDFEIFNIASGVSYSVKEIVDIVRKLIGAEVDVSYSKEKRVNEIMETVANIGKAKDVLGWEPRVGLEEGLERMIQSPPMS